MMPDLSNILHNFRRRGKDLPLDNQIPSPYHQTSLSDWHTCASDDVYAFHGSTSGIVDIGSEAPTLKPRKLNITPLKR